MLVHVIEQLFLLECSVNFIDFRSCSFIRSITALHLVSCNLTNTDMVHLSELIPRMTCLKLLDVSGNHFLSRHNGGLLKVLQQLYHSSVTTLDIVNSGFPRTLPYDIYSALKDLIEPSSGRLEELCIGDVLGHNNDEVMKIASSPSSLPLSSCIIIIILSRKQYLPHQAQDYEL